MINVCRTMEAWFESEVLADFRDWSDLHWCFTFDAQVLLPSILVWVPGPDGRVVSSYPGWPLNESAGAQALDEHTVRKGMKMTLDALARQWNEAYPDSPR